MSKHLDLEFNQSATFFKVSWLGLLVLLISLLVAAALIQIHQHQQNAYQDITASLQQQIEPINMPLKPTVLPASGNEVKQINEVLNGLSTPWNTLLLAIEQADSADVALLSIEPSLKKHQLLLTGEARNLQAALYYVQQLEAQAMLSEAYLQKHSLDETNVSKPVRFSVQAKWSMLP